MVNPNSWYIHMHFDRLTFELLIGDNVEEKIKKGKNRETKNNPLPDEEKSSD